MARSTLDVYNFLLNHVLDRLTVKPDRVQIIPGTELAWDNPCGQLSLRVPQAATTGNDKLCPDGVTTHVYISLLRCVSTTSGRGNPPPVANVNAEGSDYVRDMHEVGNALFCLEVPEGYEDSIISIKVVEFQGLGADGGMAGGEWHLEIKWAFPWLP